MDKVHIEFDKVIPIEYVKMRAGLIKLDKAFKDQRRRDKQRKVINYVRK